MATLVISVEKDYKKAYEDIKAKQKDKNQKKYLKNKEAIKAKSLAYYHAHREEINKKKNARAMAARVYKHNQLLEEKMKKELLVAQLAAQANANFPGAVVAFNE